MPRLSFSPLILFQLVILAAHASAYIYHHQPAKKVGGAFLAGAIAMLVALLSKIGHEYGHILAGQILEVAFTRVEIGNVLGSYAKPLHPDQLLSQVEQFTIFSAGVLVNAALALFFSTIKKPAASWITKYNLWMVAINLLPIPGLDGWRIIQSPIWLITGLLLFLLFLYPLRRRLREAGQFLLAY